MRTGLTAVLAWLALGAQAPDIHFVPTTDGIIDAMLTMAHITPDDVVYDLGSGEGAIVIRAAEKYGARGVGVEIDPQLVKTANERARKRGVADKVRFLIGDLFQADISEATIVTLYLSPSINRRLETKLMSELQPGTRVVSHRFEMYGWPAEQKRSVSGRPIYLWTIR